MAARTRNFHKPSVSQHIRDRNARQSRSDFLARLFKTLCGTLRQRFTPSVSDARANT